MAVITNPAGLHNPVDFGYSHVSETSGIVFIGGQYASDLKGHIVSTGFAAQVEKAFENLGVALAAAGLSFSDVNRLGTFIVDHDETKLEALLAVVHRIWGDRPPAQTLIAVAGLALPGMLFEVDAIAVRP